MPHAQHRGATGARLGFSASDSLALGLEIKVWGQPVRLVLCCFSFP